MMDERGQVKTGIIIMVLIIAFFAIYALFSPALDEIWGVTENEAPSNAPDSIWNNLRLVWPAMFVIAIILFFVWLFARAGRTEHEYSTFYNMVPMEVKLLWW